MSRFERYRCDGECGLHVVDYASARGWIHLSGSISRARGTWSGDQWNSEHLRDKHFCSLECLDKALRATLGNESVATPTRPPAVPMFESEVETNISISLVEAEPPSPIPTRAERLKDGEDV